MAFSYEYDEVVKMIADYYNTSAPQVDAILSQYGATSAEEATKLLHTVDQYYAGSKISYATNANGTLGAQYMSSVRSTVNATNSNQILRSQIRTPVNSTWTTSQGVTTMSAKVGLREAGHFAFGEVLPAIAAAGWGITLGKTIDRALYNANPNFWDAHGMSTLNPDTWNSITTGYDGVAGSLFNMIFGLNGDKSQAYLDEDAAAYLALWLKNQGVFLNSSVDTTPIQAGAKYNNSDFKIGKVNEIAQYLPYTSDPNNRLSNNTLYGIIISGSINGYPGIYTSSSPITITSSGPYEVRTISDNNNRASIYPTLTFSTSIAPYCYIDSLGLVHNAGGGGLNQLSYVGTYHMSAMGVSAAVNIVKSSAIDGIGDQPGATLPDTSDWNDLPSTKASLQRQYPDLWNNAKHNDYVDKDGNQQSKTYIPINLPNTTNKNDTQPTSGDRSQGDPEVDPATALEDLLKTITEELTKTPTETDTTPTGGGSSPDVVPPTGSASSLWAVYNPTQAQVDAFGSWLWSSDFIEQIKKLFNDPMQAIIGIHKVYATPSTGTAQNIKCGYIDSGVSAATVTSQYTDINCGTVSLNEYYGNVFDYSPYTKVSIYLPFIGIADLDVADVMRSTISVKYHVDVITGACLADVKVSRDGANSVLYQYAGSCIVSYPLSSGSYASAVAGILSIAGGAVASIASGGALAPVALGAAVGATQLHSDIKKSGSFTGAAGAMGSKKPYLIVSRPQTAMPSSFMALEGKPASHYVKIGDCNGFIKVKAVHVKNTDATDAEVLKIESLLKEGVEV